MMSPTYKSIICAIVLAIIEAAQSHIFGKQRLPVLHPASFCRGVVPIWADFPGTDPIAGGSGDHRLTPGPTDAPSD
jgi:hypothetical protein